MLLRYVIVGAGGFVGFHVARRLLDHAHCVWGLDDGSGGGDTYERNVSDLKVWALYRHAPVDCRKPQSWASAFIPRPWEVDRAIWIADLEDPSAKQDLQYNGIRAMVQWATQEGRHTKRHTQECEMAMKRQRECCCRPPRLLVVTHPYLHDGADEACVGAALPIRVVRLFDVFGPRMPQRAWMRQLIEAARKGLPVEAPTRGSRTLLHVEDASVAICKAVDRAELDGVQEIGGPDEWRDYDIAREVHLQSEARGPLTPVQGLPLRQAQADNRSYKILNWEPKRKLASSFDELQAWYQYGRDLVQENEYDVAAIA